ncbi:protein takeout [Anabrus simplex]|uniref:protein takeout n=1 Tax=Anabrus simplex TaxID=316456 RepID=UPI0034DDBF54
MSRYVVLCLVVLVAACKAAPSPSAIGKKLGLCSRKTPDLDTCLRNRLQVLIPDVIKNGFPELDLLPSEPAYIKELLVQYRNGNWTADMALKNTKTYGISGVQIHRVRTQLDDPKNFHAEIDFTMPAILVEGDYKVDAKLFGIPLNTKGFFNISMTNVSATWDITGVHINKGGEDFVRVTRFSMLPEVGDLKVYGSNLIPGNEELSQAAVAFFNRYWRFVYQELLPVSNDTWGNFMKDALNLIFLRVPFKELFPEA